MKDERNLYAVVIRRKDGSEFFAGGKDAVAAIFWKWQKAQEYRRELAAYSFKARVRKVRVTIESL